MAKKDNLVTKDFLKRIINDFRDEVKAEFGKMRNENFEMKDKIIGEIKAVREDFDAHSFLHQTTNDTLDNHETRLRKLEKPSL